MEENSISIINRTNGQLTGEKAQALPIMLKGAWKWTSYVAAGIIVGLIIAIVFVATATNKVVAVQVAGRSDNFQIMQVQ